MAEKQYLSYNEYGQLMNELFGRLTGTYTHLYGNPRGGLPIAVHLSHLMNLPLIVTEDDLVAELYCTSGCHVLIVDDITDTGRSLIRLSDLLRALDVPFTTACLYHKPRSSFEPDIWLRRISNDNWIVFPWEHRDERPNRPLE